MIFSRRQNNSVPDTGPVYLTEEGVERLKRKLERLKREAPRLAAEAERTAAYGDRSENAEYKEAKGALRRTNAQIIHIESQLKRIVKIMPGKYLGGVAGIGSTVEIESSDGKKRTFQIIGRLETNPDSGRISNESPLGKAILGKKAGEKIIVETPGGEKEYVVLKVN